MRKIVTAVDRVLRAALRSTGCLAVLAVAFALQSSAFAATLPAVKAAMACSDLLKLDFSYLEDAPAKLNSATLVSTGTAQPYCWVKGYVAPAVNFEVRMPTDGWTQRLVMLGCGGYCGTLINSFGSTPSASNGCARVASGELTIAYHDGGHAGSLNTSGILAAIADGMWAIDNPTGLIDFFYKANHKATVATKAVMEAFYGQQPRYAYFDGCSSGGRAGLHVAQRYPNDYDGILAGAPTIDNTATNTFLHAWNVRANSNPDGTAILTSDKIPSLAAAVLAACADASGQILDPRTCHFDAKSIACTGIESAGCLTAAQADAANRIYKGAVDEHGTLLQPGGMPYGSELAWVGSMVLAKGVVFDQNTSSDFAFSYDFPNYMSNWFVTGITNRNMEFTSAEFALLDTMAPLNDPTNPDLRAFAGQGGKLIMWQGWADSGTSPYSTLNYYDAVRKYMGQAGANSFMKLYMIPGMYHCAGAPTPAQLDMLTPLMNWVEDKIPPAQVDVSYAANVAAGQAARTRPAFPYPAMGVYSGQGDIHLASSYTAGTAPAGVSDMLDWAGLKHYRPNQQQSCEINNGVPTCHVGGGLKLNTQVMVK